MPPRPKRVYWDASVILSLFQKPDTDQKGYQREQAILLMKEARAGETLIITSALTLAEARRGEGLPPLSGEDHATISAFLRHSYIEIVPLDRGIAEYAAELGEQFNLKPADAVQLATAVRVNASVFLAWDRGFHRQEAMKGAPIPIEEPRWVGARQMELGEKAVEVAPGTTALQVPAPIQSAPETVKTTNGEVNGASVTQTDVPSIPDNGGEHDRIEPLEKRAQEGKQETEPVSDALRGCGEGPAQHAPAEGEPGAEDQPQEAPSD